MLSALRGSASRRRCATDGSAFCRRRRRQTRSGATHRGPKSVGATLCFPRCAPLRGGLQKQDSSGLGAAVVVSHSAGPCFATRKGRGWQRCKANAANQRPRPPLLVLTLSSPPQSDLLLVPSFCRLPSFFFCFRFFFPRSCCCTWPCFVLHSSRAIQASELSVRLATSLASSCFAP